MARFVSELPHIPLGSETRYQVVLGAHHVPWQTADPVRSHADVVHMDIRNARSVAADAARIARRVIREPPRRCKVQVVKRPGLPQSMSAIILVPHDP